MAELPTQYSIVAIDIESFSARTNFQQASLRAEMYQVISAAARCASLRWDEFHTEDRDAGILLLIPPWDSPVRLAAEFIAALNQCLAGRAEGRTATQAMRMRVALHQGVASDWSWEAVDLACRLVEAQPVRETLRGATRAQLAFVVPDAVYHGVICQKHPRIDAGAYAPVRLDAGQFLDTKAWITVPGYAAPPGVEQAGASEPVTVGAPGNGPSMPSW